MRGYDDERDDYEDYYEDEGQEQYEEEGEEEYEEEEEEPRKPSKEEQEYLEMRQKLKESFRKKLKKESSGSSTSRLDSTDRRKNKLPYDNYGSFFGPSQPVIAQRVIQESKSFIENKHLAPRVSNPHHVKKNPDKVPSGGSKSSSHNLPPKVREMKVKAQKLKNTRDYSFLLSDDAELPAPSKARPPQNMPIRNSEGRPAQVPARSKLPLSNGKHVHASHEERKLGTAAGRLPPKSGSSYTTSSTGKPSMASSDSRKQLGNINGNGPGRPVGPKGLPPKVSVATSGNKSSTPGIKNHVNSMQKSLPSKTHPSIPKQSMEQRIPKQSMEQRIPKQSTEQRIPKQSVEQRIPRQSVEQRKDIREINRPKMTPKQQINKPLKQNSMRTASQNHRPKPKVARRPFDDEEDEMDISNMIRSMFNYNPRNFVDDEDDDDMEAGFDEIMREERRSAQIARKEDEEQLRLIEEEEEKERERRRRMAKLKKRKFGE
ncbi:protein SPT2 homolog isoform X1 [Cajanus cajan]|uniref:protein SPT2 homolog isoform X1 n=1 Tax=Cajanus cajan TaxID=3821 RepID=UPI00098D8868|nr:protein SPT2 homolog isoform X1 [Cajanus cajan]XP_020223866.1 protein SPT2 homolog isoform X1 [Cajanus cajan]